MSANKVLYDLFNANYSERHSTDAATLDTRSKSSMIFEIVTAAAETRTLATPVQAGLDVLFVMYTDGGDCTITAGNGFDAANSTTFVLDDVGDFVWLKSINAGGTYRWRVITSEGVTETAAESTAAFDTITEVTSAKGVDIDGVLLRDGIVWGKQADPTAETGVATITVADIISGIVTISHTTGSTIALTLDTGTAMDSGDPSAIGTDRSIDWHIINLSAAAADTATLTAASGHTIVGNPIVQSTHVSTGGITGSAAMFRSRRTAAATWITYRIA